MKKKTDASREKEKTDQQHSEHKLFFSNLGPSGLNTTAVWDPGLVRPAGSQLQTLARSDAAILPSPGNKRCENGEKVALSETETERKSSSCNNFSPPEITTRAQCVPAN